MSSPTDEPLLGLEQARALGDETRREIVRHLGGADGPVGVAELTDHLGLNHNAVRQHLAKLVAAALVVQTTEHRDGPGRPRLVYQLSDVLTGAAAYERLAVWLTETIATGDTPVDVGRRAGRALALSADADEAPLDGLAREMRRHGFDPEIRHGSRRTELVLRQCPFASAALADAETICNLHLGLAEGIVEDVDDLEISGLVVRDPRRAGCRLVVESGPDLEG